MPSLPIDVWASGGLRGMDWMSLNQWRWARLPVASRGASEPATQSTEAVIETMIYYLASCVWPVLVWVSSGFLILIAHTFGRKRVSGFSRLGWEYSNAEGQSVTVDLEKREGHIHCSVQGQSIELPIEQVPNFSKPWLR